jgi:outer membrane protein OmpA-like peptidoglycan-associated protein/Mg-chelatase subunit ChlD
MRFVRPVISLMFLVTAVTALAQPPRSPSTLRGQSRADDSIHTARLEMATVLAKDTTLRVTIRNIDISRFPVVSIIFDVQDRWNNFVDELAKKDIIIRENDEQQDVISLSMITSDNRVPVDFVFAIDQTGSMGDKIEGVKANIDEFTTRLVAKGIDYRLGLIVFDDHVAQRYWLTDDLAKFKGWVEALKADGGGDTKENALEAMRAATGMNFRQSANRCIVLVTDAPFHEYNDGTHRTMYTSRTIATLLSRFELRTFAIVQPTITGYRDIALSTGGQVFDVNRPFVDILNQFVSTMTSLYTATYRSAADIIPDSVQVEIKLSNGKVARKRFAVLEIGRKLVVDNILFATGQASIETPSQQSLDYLVRLMKARPTLKLKIEGHTDDVGDEESNLKLSLARADAVRQYMVRRGIDRNRLFTIGYGKSRPTARNDTDTGRRLNRRTEFIIVQK